MNTITINFLSLQFDKDIINSRDKIKISATTFPGQYRQSIIIDPKKMRKTNNSLNLKINKDFKMLIFIFEKKSFFQFNPLIASRAVDAASFSIPSTESINIEPKTFNIYKPVRCQNDANNLQSRIAGKMTIKCFISNNLSYKNENSPYNISKIHKGNGYSTIDDDSKNGNQLFLLDEEYIN